MSLLCEVYHLIWLSLNISTFNILITYSIMKYTGTTKQCLAIFKYTAWQLINAYEILVVLLLLLLSSASYYHPGLPWWLRQERIRLQCGRPGFDLWVGKIPWRRAKQPTPVFLPGESHGQRRLAGYSPWATKSWIWLSEYAQCFINNCKVNIKRICLFNFMIVWKGIHSIKGIKQQVIFLWSPLVQDKLHFYVTYGVYFAKRPILWFIEHIIIKI